MNFIFTRNEFDDVVVIEPRLFHDERGYFCETYKASQFRTGGISDEFIQDNQSFSKYGVIRGLHFQHAPKAQAKLVRCIAGEIYDCIVDLRRSSKTFGKHFGINLSAENKLMLYVPAGFAHGFSTLSQTAEVCYKVSAEYDPKLDAGLRFDDPDLAIDWKVSGTPLVSSKDSALPLFRDLAI
ncbi:MAG: dTDP-4-dehydrorhamnose 3,5-epimerase [Alphaproteobacteria bacterium]|nr:dTDP-4-dehydrorhamnose 3,5-epimerase [Alphaproteobacteria bacterium]